MVGHKEASGDIAQMIRVIELCGERFTLLSGDDNLLLPARRRGKGRGLGHLEPVPGRREWVRRIPGAASGRRASPFTACLRCRRCFSRPIPYRSSAMEMMGWCGGEVRLPLVAPGIQQKLHAALTEFGAVPVPK